MAKKALPTRERMIIDGKEYRRVTEIIDALGFNRAALMGWANWLGTQGKSHKAESREAADLGTELHKWIERYWRKEAQPVEDAFTTDKERKAAAMFEPWKKWRKENLTPIEILHIEHRFRCDQTFITGSPDLIARTKQHGIAVFDWKTSSDGKPKPEHWIQQGGYSVLIEQAGIAQERAVLVVVNKKTKKVEQFAKTMEQLQPWRELFWAAFHVVEAGEKVGLEVER